MVQTRDVRLNMQALLLRERGWTFLRYQHLREGIRLAQGIRSVLCVDAGKAHAELALAVEFPDVHFHITDLPSNDGPGHAPQIGLAERLGISNVTWGTLDVFARQSMNWDLVTSLGTLARVEDDKTVAANMHQLANQYVFALVPFAHKTASNDPAFQRRLLQTNQQHRVGYDAEELAALFPNTVETRGCYWDQEGRKLRRRLGALENDQIQSQRDDLLRLAERDVRRKIPRAIAEASGIWTLARTN